MDFPLDEFRELYEQFSAISDTKVLFAADNARCLLPDSSGCHGCLKSLWLLMVAHMLQIGINEANGQGAAGAVVSATIDKASVSFAQAPVRDQRDQWLGLTPFGRQFQVMLDKCMAGAGFSVGGKPEMSAFRGVGSLFTRGR